MLDVRACTCHYCRRCPSRRRAVSSAQGNSHEFFLVLDGQFDVALRDADGGERSVNLRAGDVFVVPKGTEHKPSSPGGSILMFEPTETLSTGDWHEGDIPGHVQSTTGAQL